LTIPLILAGLLFFWLGWKARGLYEHRPRWLKWGRKKESDPRPGGGTPTDQGVIGRLSRTGERIIGKGVEAVFGKPKDPKDKKEDE
jgi:hypothetical protein